jgi:hypothetical protein
MTDVRRRFLVAAGLGAALATILFVLVLQSGRAGVFDRDLLGNFYDGQGRALLDGHIDVDPDIPGFEGFRIGDETHIYQGIAPTLVRLPLLAATDRFDGRLTGVSMTLGFIASMASVIAAAWRLRRITRGDAPIGRLELACTTIATFGIGGGSLLFLASKAWVYHEALIWGTATCLASLTFLLYWLDGRRAADTTADSGDADSGGADSGERSTGRGFATLVPAVVLAGVTLNTRTSVGLGPIAALGLVSLCLLLGLVTRRRAPDDGDPGDETPGWAERVSGWTPARSTTAPAASLVVVVVGVLLSVVLYAGVNQARFGSAFSVPLDRQALVANDVARQEALAANDNSLFGLQYVPSVLLQVVRPDAIGVRNAFPYLGFPEQRPAVVGDAVFAELDWSASVPASQPMLFLAGLIGLVVLIAPRRFVRGTPDAGDGVAVARIPVVGAAVGGSVIVVFGYIAQRYVTDLFPVAALAGLVGLTALGTRLAPRPASTDGGAADRPTDDRPTGDRPTDRRWALVAGVAVLVVTSLWTVWANAGMALQYGNEVAPGRSEADRAAWLELQERLGGSFDVVAVDPDDELPPAGPVGQLAVVGDCDGLYRSNGTVWYLIESGEAEDGLRLSVARDGELDAPLTLLGTQGAGARLVLEPLGGDVVRLVVEVDRPDGIQRSLVGAEFELPDASTTPLDVSFDRRTDDVVVTGPDSEVLRVQIDLPEGAVTPGGPPPGGAAAAPDAAAPDAAVTVTAEGSATPLCDRILR